MFQVVYFEDLYYSTLINSGEKITSIFAAEINLIHHSERKEAI